MFEIVDQIESSAVIKVIGVGGGGGNAVHYMLKHAVEGVEFIVANTDSQAMRAIPADRTLQLGGDITKGLGAGANPDVGRNAAIEDRDAIVDVLTGTDMVFITAGMGGGTGTGAAPVVAEIARDLGILTVAIVTRPFGFEGRRRAHVADQGITALEKHVDSLIVVPNEKLLPVLGKNSSLMAAFGEANNVLHGAVRGIADLIIRPGMINVDFADVRTVMSEMGKAMMGTGAATGEDRAVMAAEVAIRSPLLEDVDLSGARGILVNITSGPDFTLGEFDQVGKVVEQISDENANVVIGTVIDPEMSDQICVTVVATGLGDVLSPKTVVDNGQLNNEPREAFSSADAPQILRAQAIGNTALAQDLTEEIGNMEEMERILNIPAFLRRQAD
ncbi:MAG TPA: cell division protein FtsZ [Gammaproteobacteria bacterium]|nr:cell division protein FtsZ [Gammaproteobacteria bacterium]|tara:strand:- start:173 stop:1336 length:1164 start_codon:yes stop_codon:yes gene_type:complete